MLQQTEKQQKDAELKKFTGSVRKLNNICLGYTRTEHQFLNSLVKPELENILEFLRTNGVTHQPLSNAYNLVNGGIKLTLREAEWLLDVSKDLREWLVDSIKHNMYRSITNNPSEKPILYVREGTELINR